MGEPRCKELVGTDLLGRMQVHQHKLQRSPLATCKSAKRRNNVAFPVHPLSWRDGVHGRDVSPHGDPKSGSRRCACTQRVTG